MTIRLNFEKHTQGSMIPIQRVTTRAKNFLCNIIHLTYPKHSNPFINKKPIIV